MKCSRRHRKNLEETQKWTGFLFMDYFKEDIGFRLMKDIYQIL
jgi:hypothetical protein